MATPPRSRMKTDSPPVAQEHVKNYGAAFASFANRHPGWTQKAVNILNDHKNFGKFGLQYMLANELRKAYEQGLAEAPPPEGDFPPEIYEEPEPDIETTKAALPVLRSLTRNQRDRYMVGPDTATKRLRMVAAVEEELEAAGESIEEEPAPGRVLIRRKPVEAKPVTKLIRRAR